MSPPALGIQIIQKLTSYYFKVENLKEGFQVSNSSWKKKKKKSLWIPLCILQKESYSSEFW